MLYSFALYTAPLNDFTKFNLTDGTRDYGFVMGKGDSEHYYFNIPVERKPTVLCDVPCSLKELSWGNSEFESNLQRSISEPLTVSGSVRYRVRVNGTPTHAVVMFPPYRGNRGFEAPYGVVPAEKFEFDDCLFISFQDPYFANGSYMLSDNQGGDPLPQVGEIIANEATKFGLSGTEMTFIGSSKGANIAAIVSEDFEGNQLVLSGYATDLVKWVAHNGQASLIPALDYFGKSLPDALAILKREAERKEVHWFYSVDDVIANSGNEGLTSPNLVTYPCEEPHGSLFKHRWEDFADIIRHRKSK